MLYTVHFTAFCLGGRFYPDTVYIIHRSVLIRKKYNTTITIMMTFSHKIFFNISS